MEALIEEVDVAVTVAAAATTTFEAEAVSEEVAAEDLGAGVAAEALTEAKTKDLQNM